MEMQQIRYFLAVSDELNFSRAAEKCNITQPALSRAIQQLEAELGGQLIRRARHLTHLTELGQMVRPHLEMIHRTAATAKQLAQDVTQLKRVPLKLGIMSTISPDEIVYLIASLKSRHRVLELQLCDASAPELRDRLLGGSLEVAIYALPGEEPDELTHIMPLFREQMVIAVNHEHRLANERAFPVRELNGESYIHRMNCEFAGYADHILQTKGVTCTPTYWSERDDWTLAMVAAGLGFAFMPANSVTHPDVVGLPVVEPEFWRVVNLVTVRGRPYSSGVGALVQEAMSKKWFGNKAISARLTEEKQASQHRKTPASVSQTRS